MIDEIGRIFGCIYFFRREHSWLTIRLTGYSKFFLYQSIDFIWLFITLILKFLGLIAMSVLGLKFWLFLVIVTLFSAMELLAYIKVISWCSTLELSLEFSWIASKLSDSTYYCPKDAKFSCCCSILEILKLCFWSYTTMRFTFFMEGTYSDFAGVKFIVCILLWEKFTPVLASWGTEPLGFRFSQLSCGMEPLALS